MNKKIKELSKLILSDDQYTKLKFYLNQNDFTNLNKARILVEDILNDAETDLECSKDEFDKMVLLTQVQDLDKLLDEIFNLYEEDNEREQIKQDS